MSKIKSEDLDKWTKKVRWFRRRGLFETYQFISERSDLIFSKNM